MADRDLELVGPDSVRPRPSTECGRDGCTERRVVRSPWCEGHTHDWIAAAEVPLDPQFVAGAARTNHTEIREHTFIRVLEVVCSQCRRGFSAARDEPCEPMDDVLKGGPLGTRQRRDGEDDDLDGGVAGDTHPLDAVASGS